MLLVVQPFAKRDGTLLLLTLSIRKMVVSWTCDNGRPGRVTSNRITTLTTHDCVENEGHHWKDQRAGDVRRLCQVITKRAHERFVIDCDPRTQDPQLTQGSARCRFYQKRSTQVWRRVQVSTCVDRQRRNMRSKRGKGNGTSKEGDDSERSSGAAKGTPDAGTGVDKKRCNEVTDPRHWGTDLSKGPSSTQVAQQEPIMSSNPPQRRHTRSCHSWRSRRRSRVSVVSLAECLSTLSKTMPVQFTTHMVRVNRTGMKQGVDYQRFLEYHAKKDALMMTVDTGAEIHKACERHENDCTTERQ